MKKKRAKLDTRGLKKDVWLVDTAHNQEVSGDVFTWDSEYPAGFVLTNGVRSIFEAHLALFAGENETTLSGTLKERLLLVTLIDDFLPLELISRVCRVYSHETLRVLDICTKTFELDNAVFRIDLSHILFLAFTIGRWRELKVDHGSLSDTIALNNQRLLLRVRVHILDVGRKDSRHVSFHFEWVEFDNEVIITARRD